MMGMSDLALFSAWYATYFVIFGATALLIAIISSKTLFPNSSFFILLVYFFMYGASSVAVCFCIR